MNKVIQQKMPHFVHIIHFLQMYVKFKTKESKDKLSKSIKSKLKNLKYNEILDLAEVMETANIFKHFYEDVNTARVNKLSRSNHVEDFLVAFANSNKYKTKYVKKTLENDYRYIVNQNNNFPIDNLYNLSRKLTMSAFNTKGRINEKNKQKFLFLANILRERNNNVSNNEQE